jgi:hypothetical protein
VAIAIWDQDKPNWGPTWESLTDDDRDYYCELAAAAIAKLGLKEETQTLPVQVGSSVTPCTCTTGNRPGWHTCDYGARAEFNFVPHVRWVSDWSAVRDD